MPIFEYRCADCDSEFEKIVFKEPETVQCPTCRSVETRKLLSTFAVSAAGSRDLDREVGPCHCGAPRRGMCREN